MRRLCRACAQGYADPKPAQRLVTETHVRFVHKLRAPALQGLPYAVAPNPINPAFVAMHLYRKVDVRRRALEAGWRLRAGAHPI